MKLESFWQATAPVYLGSPPGDLPATADVVVIGAGFTGMSAALALARAGVDVTVLEAERVMSQASARNGGHCNTGVAQNFTALVASRGLEQASRFYHAYAGAVDYVQRLVEQEHIDCDFLRCGKLKLASKASHFPALRAAHDLMRATVDPDIELIGAEDIRHEIGSGAFHGGLLQRRGGQMHMGKFGIGLAQAAAGAGARIVEHTPVTGLKRIAGRRHRVSTARGEIVAEKVLLATGCSNVGPFDYFKRRIVPVGSFVVVTEPLDPALLSELFPQIRTYVTSLNIGNYFRTTVDNRLVFGGRARFAISNPTSDARSGAVLQAALGTLFPALANARIDYCWGGLVDMTADRLPHAGEQDGVFYSLGYSGHGTQMSVWMGKVMADLLTEQADANPWRRDSWPAVPGYFGKPWFLPMAGWYYKAKDRFS
ncbi:NAD(P)/FAD-dependent oxidoreductase [Acerihabitans arboris]|uniref:FAD-dependent oxidoreductase n=1 Tax=Acerihabitans arboris TaxID=2691583 RepID=A0A845SGP7_9GAMM|nr:FAD-binding oxidoreductase [Acerihabitans arboris]NDL62226.1 FAD-dependent oxidoreductase [Acerihabitans arboris]